MEFIDTHAHLYANQFEKDRDKMLQRAMKRGINRFYLPNIDSGSIAGMLELEAKYPQNCFAMMGLHPCSVKGNYKEELAIVEDWLGKRKFCAVGEIGIDLHWDKSFFEQQKIAFRTQINWAKELDIPIVIHAREATRPILDLVREEKDHRLRGIFHCFGGSVEEAKEIIDLGFLVGIGGVLTYKKSGLTNTLREVPLAHIVLETDAPYLAPVPYRGKRNESSYIFDIAQKLAEAKEVGLGEVAKVTTANALKLFHK